MALNYYKPFIIILLLYEVIKMPKLINEIGNKYGKLTVLERAKTKKKGVYWHCRCECGNEVDVLGTSLRNGNTKSCGCLQKEKAS